MGNILGLEERTIVFIEGNISCGKSTLLQWLEKQGHSVLPEETHNWRFLSRRYEDAKRWAFTLQVEIFLSMVGRLEQQLFSETCPEVIFVERSLESCLLFSEVAYLEGFITEDEYDVLKRLMGRSKNKVESVCDVRRVYIDCPVDECQRRLVGRGSCESKSVDTNYLAKVNSVFANLREKSIIVDGTQSTEDIGGQMLQTLLESE